MPRTSKNLYAMDCLVQNQQIQNMEIQTMIQEAYGEQIIYQ